MPPLAVVQFNHARLELWSDHCRTVFPDGRAVPASPNGADDILTCVAHESLHHLHAQAVHDAPSYCLRAVADGDGLRWTPRRREEEAFAFGATPALVDLLRAIITAYGKDRP